MSEPAPDLRMPPPLPTIAPPVPVQPVPVQPLSEITHEYQLPADGYENVRHRPGIITAIAIISITVGSLGLFAGGLSALYGGIFYFIAKTTASMTAAQNSAMAQAAAAQGVPQRLAQGAAQGAALPSAVADEQIVDPSPDPVVGERGLDIPARQIIIDVLATLRPLNDSRKHQLHALLANAGQDAFASSRGNVNAGDVRQAINQTGQLPRASDSDPQPGPDFFVIAAGRIEVSDDRAIFEPADHSQETVRVSAPLPSTDNQATGASREREVDTTFGVKSKFSYSTSVTSPPTTAQTSSLGNGSGSISGAAASLVVVEGAMSILLSIYLLVIGTLTLRQNPRGRRLHVIYAFLKIPLAILCGVAWCWIVGGFFTSMHAPGGTTQIQTVRAFLLTLVTGVAIIYPIALLITFCTATVRRYYDSDPR